MVWNKQRDAFAEIRETYENTYLKLKSLKRGYKTKYVFQEIRLLTIILIFHILYVWQLKNLP